mmetsp:Transcript_1871/g.2381  ORF Transcript_1871/g.2381 Transcript_1871/m.2381 type:complete len:209 (-) Transcript_1871:2715-3341(-)
MLLRGQRNHLRRCHLHQMPKHVDQKHKTLVHHLNDLLPQKLQMLQHKINHHQKVRHHQQQRMVGEYHHQDLHLADQKVQKVDPQAESHHLVVVLHLVHHHLLNQKLLQVNLLLQLQFQKVLHHQEVHQGVHLLEVLEEVHLLGVHREVLLVDLPQIRMLPIPQQELHREEHLLEVHHPEVHQEVHQVEVHLLEVHHLEVLEVNNNNNN